MRMMWTVLLAAGCGTETMVLPPPSEPPGQLTPAPTPPVAPSPSVPASGKVTMHDLRGLEAGTAVTVSGFLVSSEGGTATVSADSEGKTLLLRCEGGSAPETARETQVSVSGTTAAPDGEVSVLTGCTVTPTGVAPVDLDIGGTKVKG